MSLVLELEQPILLLTVHGHGDVDGAGVDFLGLVDVLHAAPLFDDLCAAGADVHEGLGTLVGLLLAVDLHPFCQVLVIGGLHLGILHLDALDVGAEGGVAAVVRPVGVHHTQLGDGGIPMLGVSEIALEEGQVVQIHSQAVGGEHFLQLVPILADEAVQSSHFGGDVVLLHQGFGLFCRGFPCFHRVDEVTADLLAVLIGQVAQEDVDGGGLHQRPVAASQ